MLEQAAEITSPSTKRKQNMNSYWGKAINSESPPPACTSSSKTTPSTGSITSLKSTINCGTSVQIHESIADISHSSHQNSRSDLFTCSLLSDEHSFFSSHKSLLCVCVRTCVYAHMCAYVYFRN